MLQWIAKLFPQISPRDESIIATFDKDDLQSRIISYTKPCGHPGIMVEVMLHVEAKDAWIGTGIFGGEELHNVIMVLQQSASKIGEEAGCRELPTVFLGGAMYFVDERLRQFRNVENPHECFSFTPEL